MKKEEIYDLLKKHYDAMCCYDNDLKMMSEGCANGILLELITCYKNSGFKSLYSDFDIDNDENFNDWMYYSLVDSLFSEAVSKDVEFKTFNRWLYEAHQRVYGN